MTSASGLPTVACVVITKNKEHNLQTVASLSIGVNEDAVIDAESSDRKADLAPGGGAKEENWRNARKLTRRAFKLPLSWKTVSRFA